MQPKYKRVLIKLSGEAFLGEREYGIDPKFTQRIAEEIKQVHALGVQIAIVIGGGNIFRGAAAAENGLDRTTGDYIGMLAGIMNALALQDSLEKAGVDNRVQSAIEIPRICEPFIRKRAIRHMEKGRVVIFAAGTGNPYFTHDTAAALRALEIHADVLLKASMIDGVYSDDPKKAADATRFESLSYDQAFHDRNIKVMDKNAFALCMEHKLPIIIFQLTTEGNLVKAVEGKKIGTLIS